MTILGPEEHRQGDTCLRSAGAPLTGVELSIRDPSGGTLPAGETGEVCVRGGNIMVEYWRQPEATAAALRDGWLDPNNHQTTFLNLKRSRKSRGCTGHARKMEAAANPTFGITSAHDDRF